MLSFENLEELSQMLTQENDPDRLAEIGDRFMDCRDALANFRKSLTTNTLHLEEEILDIEDRCEGELRRAEKYIRNAVGDL